MSQPFDLSMLDDLESWLHLRELEDGVRHALGHSDVDPLRRLMDATQPDPWEYLDSKTDLVLPGQMHPKQMEQLLSEARHRWLFWANQTGKTTLGAVDVDLMALGRHPMQRWEPPLLIWASALTWELWETILLPEILTWLPPSRIIDAPVPKQKSTKRTILVRADNGHVTRIVGKSAEQGAAKYQSARVHHVWMDEEHPESIYDEIQPRLLRFGGTTSCTATPLLGLTWMYHRIYAPWKLGESPDHYCTHAGLADNPSITPQMIAAITKEYESDPAQAEARLYGRFAMPTGIAIRFNPVRHMQAWTDGMADTIKEQGWTHVAGIDFGYWRFAFVHGVVDRAGRLHVAHEIFSQKETLDVRARKIHNYLESADAPPNTRMWGDAANPTDILQLNKEFRRIGSPYRVRAVRAEHKARAASVELTNSLLTRGALIIKRHIGHRSKWKLGQSAASEGRYQVGSRLMYEIGQWRYPGPKDGKAQQQDPDDDTADGADMIASLRYMVMSHFRTPTYDVPEPKKRTNHDDGLDELAAKIRQNMKEEL